MQYDYERFTPDRFQEFCQALLVREYTGVQCFPVGQKDGGRDATSVTPTGAIVFQVKFRRERLKGDDGFKILKDALDPELPKIKRLVARGATQYIIMTNMAGTSALDGGSMDKMQQHLDAVLTVPGRVWWRADIDARLNNAYDLKWVFSEILTTSDALRMLMEEGLGESFSRRMLAITGYLTSQYEADEYVKFKQADLQASDLLSLFIDVPVSPQPVPRQPRNRRQEITRLFMSILGEDPETAHGYDNLRRMRIGGATLLSHTAAQETLLRVVLEGAPGQGKSTLAQYLCQVQRMRFLGKDTKLAEVPAKHRLTPAKVPFKVDLRDLATWLRRVDPITEKPLADDIPLSLEAFLAAQVTHASGGQSFSVDDLILFLSKTPGIIFLDGLDEVATTPERRSVIEAVSAASSRLLTTSPLTQMVVTSRPAAVANAPAFDRDVWDYLHLEDITEPLIFDYTDRWSAARRIPKTDVEEMKTTLQNKIASPHVKDLARNAMQLTILLNLVQARGQALPDQRTELYDQYIDVFFNREAAKNRVVLENRQLLIDLHGFLAWKMHAAAESRRSNGRITDDELRNLVSEYLQVHEYDIGVLDDLLAGVVQRIVALVSRVEGTFEFEVQPLREYFAARHLYNSAPYSPSGRPQRGTKPDIFRAIAPNPYWLNVTRFFAGCYSVGELSGLADQLEELLVEHPGGLTSFPRTLATSLLSDRVFHQAPKITKRVVSFAVDELTLRYAFQRQYFERPSMQLEFPGVGQSAAAELALKIGLTAAVPAVRREALYLLNAISPEPLRAELWLSYRPASRDEQQLHRWLEAGAYSLVLDQLDASSASEFSASSDDMWRLFAAAEHPVIGNEGDLDEKLIAEGLNGAFSQDSPSRVSRRVGMLFNPIRYELLLRTDGAHFLEPNIYGEPEGSVLGHLGAEVAALTEKLSRDFASSRLPWDKLLDLFDKACGQRTWMSWRVAAAVAASGIAQCESVEVDVDCASALDLALAARDRRSDIKWWRSFASAATAPMSKRAWLLFYVRFANPAVLRECVKTASQFVEELDSIEFGELLDATSRSAGATIPEARAREMLSDSISGRLKILLATRNASIRSSLVRSIPDDVLEAESGIANICLDWTLAELPGRQDEESWRQFIADVRHLYLYVTDPFIGLFANSHYTQMMPQGVAEGVLEDPLHHPGLLVSIADRSLSTERQDALTPVGRVVRREKWPAL